MGHPNQNYYPNNRKSATFTLEDLRKKEQAACDELERMISSCVTVEELIDTIWLWQDMYDIIDIDLHFTDDEILR